MALTCEVATSMAAVDSGSWDSLLDENNPFVEHAFLCALEASGSVGPDTGWQPHHILAKDGDKLVAALPLYERHDSFGEYIFDWGIAEAAMRAGISYYPKLTSAVPFTPATGPRLLSVGRQSQQSAAHLITATQSLANELAASSLHLLFLPPEEQTLCSRAGLLPRLSYQFHLHVHPSWRSFDDYLGAMRAPARKQVRRERQRAHKHGLRLVMKEGDELTDADRASLWRFYRSTVFDKGAYAYLTRAFFEHELASSLRSRVLAALAYAGGNPVAGSLFFSKGAHLYGRYWGASAEYDCLHFELCYYLPTEWALAHGITRFEAGAQGEHKLKRGFLPSPCYSSHWFRHSGLSKAAERFFSEEARHKRIEMAQLQAHSPFREPPR